MDVVLEQDATPLVMIIGTTLRHATADPVVAKKARGVRGVFALRSAKDPQAVTMRFGDDRVHLSRGVATDAQVIVTVDLDNMSGPDAPKPKVRGALRHLRFALTVSKLLEPKAMHWTEHARAFWTFASERPDMPSSLRVVCLDDGETLDLGNNGPEYEIHGSGPALASIFSGNSIFGQDLLDGKVFAVGTLQHASVLTGACLDYTLRGVR